ncbi:MAG: UTP--glucose-1-phosphate uridylyltransferase [Pirellulaceae bacterium]|nr:UTP--glucose-1-phosphate uridylyltransferase [Pirellulaceae bacterium]
MTITTSAQLRADPLQVITAPDAAVRDLSLDAWCQGQNLSQLLNACQRLDEFRRQSDNLYHRVRALFFLYALHRFYLPCHLAERECGRIPAISYEHLLQRRFYESVSVMLAELTDNGPSIALSSGLATAYHRLAFQTLADQVRQSVRTVKGNQWMFRTGHPADTPLRIRTELLNRDPRGAFPVLRESTSVRMDFSHSGWSDIFFLGMDYPEGARVINASIDLAVRGKHARPQPPIECSLRVLDQPVLRLVSIDLQAATDITSLGEVFDFARDYLGLLKSAVIASGLVPPGMEGCESGIEAVLSRLVGPGLGLEIVSRVNDIPKGSRLAVSTNLLGSLISACMRATGQVTQLTGPLLEQDRRIVAARAILGEWLGGSGGGWQDSGGIWPGIKLIEGCLATEHDPEYGISRGRLLPRHHVFSPYEITASTRQGLQDSLVLVHGGMAQNVGPILEMVTEKYLLRSPGPWQARTQATQILTDIQIALQAGDLRRLGQLTDQNFAGPLQQIVPWCSNHFTERMIELSRARFGSRFWGFWMLGGMAGGGMGFLFDPTCKTQASGWLEQTLLDTKRQLEHCLPFAMDPVVYDFAINDHGTSAQLTAANHLPRGYYELIVPALLRQDIQSLSPLRRAELEEVGRLSRQPTGFDNVDSDFTKRLLERILPTTIHCDIASDSLDRMLDENGFDPIQHQQLREDLLNGRLGLAQNRMPASTTIEDVLPDDVIDVRRFNDLSWREKARQAIAEGQVAVFTLAAGVGSRWTQGAGVVKALHPFCKFGGRHRTFLDLHLAKSRQVGQQSGCYPAHIVATGYLTDAPIRQHLEQLSYSGAKIVSRGQSVGLRMIPTLRDLRYAWEELPQQLLDEQQEKVRQSVRVALRSWADTAGQAADYRDNLPKQCLHPVGHWYEVPNLLRNGVLSQLLKQQPQIRTILLHNVDTLGATIDPDVLAIHLHAGACLSFEVIARRLEDRGGGLARVDGRPRLVEGLAMPNEDLEFELSYYNSMTTWIDIDRLLELFGLSRGMLDQAALVDEAIRQFARRMPTYITLKDVKKRWGNGQEDVFPVTQFERLWGDMTALPEVSSQFIVVPRIRGQQLKEPAQLDGWLRDGSAAAIEQLCCW